MAALENARVLNSGIGAIQPAVMPVSRSGTMTYEQALIRNNQRDVKTPAEQAVIDALIAGGPSGPPVPWTGNQTLATALGSAYRPVKTGYLSGSPEALLNAVNPNWIELQNDMRPMDGPGGIYYDPMNNAFINQGNPGRSPSPGGGGTYSLGSDEYNQYMSQYGSKLPASALEYANSYNQFNTGLNNLQNQFGDLNTAFTNAQNQITGFGTNLSDIQNQVGNFNTGLSDLQNQFGAFNTNFSNMQNQFGDFQNQFGSMQNQFTDQLNQGIGSITQQMEGMQGNLQNTLQGFDTRLSTVEDQVQQQPTTTAPMAPQAPTNPYFNNTGSYGYGLGYGGSPYGSYSPLPALYNPSPYGGYSAMMGYQMSPLWGAALGLF
jgi:peptidoglycan hydrolase CwlO-like protein